MKKTIKNLKKTQDITPFYITGSGDFFYDTLGQQNKFCKEDHKRLENLEVLEWLVARLQSTVEDLVQDNHMQSTVSKTTVTSAPRYAKKEDLYE